MISLVGFQFLESRLALNQLVEAGGVARREVTVDRHPMAVRLHVSDTQCTSM